MDKDRGASATLAPDAALVERVRKGEVNAFEGLVRRHQEFVARIVSGRVPAARAPEVAHDCFVRAFESLDGFNGQSPFAHWLARIAVRTCQDFWRAHYRTRETAVSGLSESCRAWLDTAAAAPDSNDDATELLGWAMDRLTEADRVVLTLTLLEGYTTAETAAMTGASVVGVKVRAFRARKRLRKLLAEAIQGAENAQGGRS